MLRVSSACVTSAIVRQIFPLEAYQKKRKYAEVRSYIASGWRKSWKIWQALLLGQLLVLMLTEFSKSIVSEPRPHFWDTCKPNVTKEICDTGYCFVCFFVCFFFKPLSRLISHGLSNVRSRYIMDFSCTSNFTKNQILDAQKSFPSGHTSVSVFSSVFMVVSLIRSMAR